MRSAAKSYKNSLRHTQHPEQQQSSLAQSVEQDADEQCDAIRAPPILQSSRL